MTRLSFLLFGCLLLPLLPGCVHQGQTASPENERSGFRLEDQKLLLAVGARLTIRKPENPTTGYSWTEPVFNRKVLRLVRSEYIGPDTDRVGAGGERLWVFEGVAPGATRIRAEYRRPWEKNEPPADTFVMNLAVGKTVAN